MLKYAKIVKQDTNMCDVGLGSDSAFYESIGMELMDVEQGYDGNWYAAGHAPEQPVSEVRTSALSRIDSATSEAILAGFEHEVEGEVLHFSYDSFDQSNFNQTANIATLALSGVEGLPESVTWNGYRNYTPETGGELVRVTLTPAAFLDLYVKGASAHKALQMELGGQKKAQIEECSTVEEINALMTEWNL